MTEYRAIADKLPEGLKSDWQGTNHFELTTGTGDDFWWLSLDQLYSEAVDCTTEVGQRLGAVFDAAAAFCGAAQRIEELEAIVATLPKCWRLDDGKLVQDYLVVPDVDLWAVPLSGIVYQWWVQFVGINGRLRGLFHDAITEEHVDRCANSREAAKAMAAKQRKEPE